MASSEANHLTAFGKTSQEWFREPRFRSVVESAFVLGILAGEDIFQLELPPECGGPGSALCNRRTGLVTTGRDARGVPHAMMIAARWIVLELNPATHLDPEVLFEARGMTRVQFSWRGLQKLDRLRAVLERVDRASICSVAQVKQYFPDFTLEFPAPLGAVGCPMRHITRLLAQGEAVALR